MRKVKKIWYDTKIISDKEKNYVFMLYQNDDKFFFMPMQSGLHIPQSLTYDECSSMNIKQLAEKEKYNEKVLKECVMMVLFLYKGGKK